MDRPAAWRSVAIDLEAERPFRIGNAAIDPLSRDAIYPGGSERLQPQTLKVLVALARRRPAVATRSELIDSCWGGRIVGEDVINRSISVLRDFAERAGGFAIETVPKAGYRLAEANASASLRRKSAIAAALIATAASFVGLWFAMAGSEQQGKPPVPTIAILPIDIQASDSVAQDLAAETRNALAHTLSEGGFPVRLSGNASQADRRTADLIISGEILRSGDLVRATIRIEQPAPRVIVFSHQFEANGADQQILPERIGAQVGAALSWTGALMALDRRHPSDPALTADLLKKATLVLMGGDPLQSYEISRRVAPKALGSAIAQVGLAFDTGFALDQLPRDQRPEAVEAGRRAADRAIAIAPEFGDVYAPWCLLHSPVLFRECENRLRSGLQADPDAPFVPSFLSGELENVGRFDEALSFARMSSANDRYKLWKIARLLRMLETEGQSAEAEPLFLQGSRWWSNHPGLIWNRWMGMLARGDFDAIARFEASLGDNVLPAADRTPPDLLTAIRIGDVATARRLCAGKSERALLTCMIALARLGDLDSAFALADDAYPQLVGHTAKEEEKRWLDHPRTAPLGLLSAPATAPMRADPRFLAVTGRVGLLRYWRAGRLPDFCRGRPEPVCARIAA